MSQMFSGGEATAEGDYGGGTTDDPTMTDTTIIPTTEQQPTNTINTNESGNANVNAEQTGTNWPLVIFLVLFGTLVVLGVAWLFLSKRKKA